MAPSVGINGMEALVGGEVVFWAVQRERRHAAAAVEKRVGRRMVFVGFGVQDVFRFFLFFFSLSLGVRAV